MKRLSDHLGALNHVSCYPFGLDMIGANNVQAGIDAWNQCFTPDFKFTVSLGFGTPTECPGEKCTLQGANSIENVSRSLAVSTSVPATCGPTISFPILR